MLIYGTQLHNYYSITNNYLLNLGIRQKKAA